MSLMIILNCCFCSKMHFALIGSFISVFILLTDSKSLSVKFSDTLKAKLWGLHVKFRNSSKAIGSELTETHFETKIKTVCKDSGCSTSTKDSEIIKGGSKKCPGDWKKFDGNCYKLLSKKASWSTSKSSCQSLNANLARILSKRENNWIRDAFRAADPVAWIDATDSRKEGDWRWSSSGKVLTYIGWKKGEPNNKRGNEDCGVVYFAGGELVWNDLPCSAEAQALCEKAA